MKRLKYLFLALILIMFSACGDDDDDDDSVDGKYKQYMREFVIGISQYSKAINPNFVIIPQNGIEIITEDGEDDGAESTEYLNAIDAHGQEDLYYGYNSDNGATPSGVTQYLLSFLNISKGNGNVILVTDYCSTHAKVDNSYAVNNAKGYIPFAAHRRELNAIPTYPSVINNENSDNITQLSQVKNFLYLINPEEYASKSAFIAAVTATNYDLLIIDLFFNEEGELTSNEVNQLRAKANGGSRMVVCYMSIGEAEDYRYYWQDSWRVGSPSWIKAENPDWEGNYKVKYWESEWQAIIFGNNSSYTKKIIDANFDGAYLDIIEAFEYFE